MPRSSEGYVSSVNNHIRTCRISGRIAGQIEDRRQQLFRFAHAVLGDLGYDDQQWELKQSLIDIARITRKVPYALAYPTGSYNDTTVELGRKYYCFGVKMNGGKWSTDGGRFTVTRSYVARTTDIGSYAALLQS